MNIDLDDVVIVDHPEASRFEARLDGQMIGFADYRRTGNTIAYPHTVVQPAYEGRGVASKLVKTALDQALAEQLTVLPQCWFVAGYIRRHPEYQPLLRK